MANPYIGDDKIKQYCANGVRPQYKEANRPLDDDYPVWPGRAVHDYAVGSLSWPASCAKHTRECREALGLTVVDPPVAELPRLIVDGILFRAGVDRWRWKGASAFRLFKQWLDGVDVEPFVAQYRDCGANLLRVFGSYTISDPDKTTWLHPTVYGNRYWDEMPLFLRWCAEQSMRVEWTALCDQQCDRNRLCVPKDVSIGWVLRMADVLVQQSHTTMEIVNEPPFNGFDPSALDGWVSPVGLLTASGNYDAVPNEDHLHSVRQYVTQHPGRDNEWPRKFKDPAREFGVTGFDWKDDNDNVIGHLQAARVPIIADEPIGADETNQPGRRSNVPSDFRDFARVAALFSAGATFHSQAGLDGVLMGPVQEQCSRAFFSGLDEMPLNAPLGQYTAGHLDDTPIAMRNELRVFSMIQGSRATSVIVRKGYTGPPPTCGDWRIVDISNDSGLVHLER